MVLRVRPTPTSFPSPLENTPCIPYRVCRTPMGQPYVVSQLAAHSRLPSVLLLTVLVSLTIGTHVPCEHQRQMPENIVRTGHLTITLVQIFPKACLCARLSGEFYCQHLGGFYVYSPPPPSHKKCILPTPPTPPKIYIYLTFFWGLDSIAACSHTSMFAPFCQIALWVCTRLRPPLVYKARTGLGVETLALSSLRGFVNKMVCRTFSGGWSFAR